RLCAMFTPLSVVAAVVERYVPCKPTQRHATDWFPQARYAGIPRNSLGSDSRKRLDERLYLRFDQVPYLLKSLRRHLFRIGDLPFNPLLCVNQRAFAPPSHRDRRIEILPVEIGQSLRAVRREVVAEFLHRFDGFRIHFPRWTRTGAERFDLS